MVDTDSTLPQVQSSDAEERGVYRLTGIDNKKKLIQELAELLSNRSSASFHQILDGINAREKMGPTYIGKGIAIPHCKLEVEKPELVIVVLEQPIKYSDDAEKIVDLVFGIVVPAAQCDEHIHILSSIAKLCDQDVWLNQLRELKTDQELYDYIVDTNSLLSDLL